jgi:hypothetical protein
MSTQTVADAVKVAELFIDHIFKLHGLAKIIISDRDSVELLIQRRMDK